MTLQDQYIPQSADEWLEWIAEQEARTLRVYIEDPDRLIADYRREKQISRGYQGREILELLQNANDAASEINIRGKVRIELRKEGLIIANTGRPFTTGGVNSLRITDLSPKLRQKVKLIGQKGLGFRSVLNWSRQPYITSGSLRLLFSDAKLRNLCYYLMNQNTKIAELLAAEKTTADDAILPALPFPIALDGDTDYLREKPVHHQIIAGRCEELRREFDTVIGMPFDSEGILLLAQGELYELQPEILLFAESIESITLALPGKQEKFWEVSGEDRRNLTICGASETKRTYDIYRERKNIPPELLSESTPGEYEVVIAVPLVDSPQGPSLLFSFFPTNVQFPFPVVCHATFELDSNRKYPEEGQLNAFIYGRIAGLLASVAESRDTSSNRWLKAATVARTQDYDTSLLRVQFGERLLQAVKQKNIIPTIHGEFKSPSSVVRIKAGNLSWLPLQGFSDVCLPAASGSTQTLMRELGVIELSSDLLRERLNALRFSSIDERASIVAGLIIEGITPRDPAPSLLIDSLGNVIPVDERIYFYPDKEQKQYDRPNWLKLHFLNDGLRLKLGGILRITERRELRQKLDVYEIQEYALANIASAIAVDARKQMDVDPKQQAQYQQEMFIALHLLFTENEEPPKLPETTGIPLPTQAGSFADSRTLYFSDGYADNGKLLAALYQHRLDLLIGSPQEIGLDGNDIHTLYFLKWLGVSGWPRIQEVSSIDGTFVSYVLDKVTYPMQNERYYRGKKSDFQRPSLRKVKSIDSLKDILNADPGAVLTWLAIDARASEWTRPAMDNGELWDHPYNAQYLRRFTTLIPSYIRWKIQYTAWLPTALGTALEPYKCMLGERGLEKLLPPPANIDHPLFDIYHINARLKRNAFENAGVMPDISHLDPEQIYQILSQLPKLDPQGKHARTFYRNLLERIDTDAMKWPEVPDSFIRTAAMWGVGPQGECYYPVRELLHADAEDFPQIVCQHLILADLPKRVGTQKVRRLFGIEPIDRNKINQTIRRAVELPESKDIQVQFQRTKPYLFYLRNVRSKQTSDIQALEALEVVLCSTVEVNIEYEEVRLSSTFERHLQWTIEDGRAYILYAESVRPSLESDLLADTIGAIVASLFNLAQGGDFARLIRCAAHERKDLLKRILGESEIPGFDKIQSDFDQALRGFTIEISEKEEKQGEGVSSKTEEAPKPNPPSERVITDTGVGTLTSTKTEHTPSPEPKKRSVIISATPGKHKPGSMIGLRKVIDPNVCEKRIIEFEELETRVARIYSHITGYNGPRCDVLSFDSKENLEAFRTSSDAGQPDLSRVARFIEVKGRSHENSPISLKGNELNAAKTYGERYYLYRLYLEGANKYVLLILQNPLNHPEVVEDVIDIYVSRATLERYDLVIENEEVDLHKES